MLVYVEMGSFDTFLKNVRFVSLTMSKNLKRNERFRKLSFLKEMKLIFKKKKWNDRSEI